MSSARALSSAQRTGSVAAASMVSRLRTKPSMISSLADADGSRPRIAPTRHRKSIASPTARSLGARVPPVRHDAAPHRPKSRDCAQRRVGCSSSHIALARSPDRASRPGGPKTSASPCRTPRANPLVASRGPRSRPIQVHGGSGRPPCGDTETQLVHRHGETHRGKATQQSVNHIFHTGTKGTELRIDSPIEYGIAPEHNE